MLVIFGNYPLPVVCPPLPTPFWRGPFYVHLSPQSILLLVPGFQQRPEGRRSSRDGFTGSATPRLACSALPPCNGMNSSNRSVNTDSGVHGTLSAPPSRPGTVDFLRPRTNASRPDISVSSMSPKSAYCPNTGTSSRPQTRDDRPGTVASSRPPTGTSRPGTGSSSRPQTNASRPATAAPWALDTDEGERGAAVVPFPVDETNDLPPDRLPAYFVRKWSVSGCCSIPCPLLLLRRTVAFLCYSITNGFSHHLLM